MKYTYLLINFFTIVVPFVYSFHPKLRFDKSWKAFFPAVFISGLVFILWDVYFTKIGVWGFNENYLIGIELFGLPLEEILFFFCIPYACVFTFHCLSKFLSYKGSKKLEQRITSVFASILLLVGILEHERIYTSTTFISLALLLLISSHWLKVNWLIRFYMVYAVLLIPFFIVNGLLTGTGLEQAVVWYNESEFMGLRLFTIPLEDVFYGMELILLNLLIHKKLLESVKTVKLNSSKSKSTAYP